MYTAISNAIIVVFGLSLGIAYGHFRRRKGVGLQAPPTPGDVPLLVTVGAIFVATFLGNFIVLNNPAIAWHVPVAIRTFFDFPKYWWTTVLLVLPFAFGTVALLSRSTSRTRFKVLLALGLAAPLLADAGFRRSPLTQIPDLREPRIENGVIRQSHGSTCSAAACAQIDKYFGIESTEANIAQYLGTTENGTSPAQVYRYFSQEGYEARKELVGDRDYRKLQAPAVLFVDFGADPLGHTISYFGEIDGMAHIIDPARGTRHLTREQLAEIWRGHAIEVARADTPSN